MSRQKHNLAVVVKKRLSSVFLIAIIFFLPQFAFADVTYTNPSRLINTVYQNTTGYPIFVRIAVYDSATTITQYNLALGATNSPTDTVDTCNSTSVANICGLVFTVPNNYYYKLNQTLGSNPVIFSWWEAAFASTTGSSSDSVVISRVDNPTLDLFLGFALFIAMMWFMVWWFKKR